MKCPKCGYNSFEYHSSCKKCSSDLGSYKMTYSITPIVLPPEARAEKADEFRIASSADEQPAESVETHEDMFSFDLPENAPSATPPPPATPKNDDPFNFADDLPQAGSKQAKTEDEGFADLLESTSQADDNPFASFAPSAPPVQAQAQTAAPASGPGEFDLENFSWDDTPAATAASSVQSAADDDFDSLFGDTGDNTKK